jgi:cation/acetate symporter
MDAGNLFVLGFVLFFVAITIVVTWLTTKSTKTASDFYVAGKGVPWVQTGIAMMGSYLSAASFLGCPGDVAIYGVDRIWLSIGFFGGYMAVLLLIAGPLRNVGSYTVADAICRRFPDRRIKLLVMITTLIISTFYLVPQMLGAGLLFQEIMGWDFLLVTSLLGVLVSVYVIFGGMKATLYNQVIQALFLFGTMVFVTVFAFFMFADGSFSTMLAKAAEAVPPSIAGKNAAAVAAAAAAPDSHAAVVAVRAAMPDAASAMTIGVQTPSLVAQISTVIALLFGTAGLPHILIMFYTVRSAKAARKSVTLCIVGLGIFYLCAIFLGFLTLPGVYPKLVEWMADPAYVGKARNLAVLVVSERLGGKFLMALSAAGAVAAVLSTAAGLMITCASTVSHDLYKTFINRNATEKQEITIAKITTLVMSAISVVLAIQLKGENVAWLVALAFGIAASAIFPVMLCNLWWRRFTRQGAIAGMAAGLLVSVFFIVLLLTGVKTFMGLSTAGGPGVFGVTVSFVVLWVVSMLTKDQGENVDAFLALAHKDQDD